MWTLASRKVKFACMSPARRKNSSKRFFPTLRSPTPMLFQPASKTGEPVALMRLSAMRRLRLPAADARLQPRVGGCHVALTVPGARLPLEDPHGLDGAEDVPKDCLDVVSHSFLSVVAMFARWVNEG